MESAVKAPGSNQSSWSLGWGAPEPVFPKSPQIKKYHNESKLYFQDNSKGADKQQSNKREQKQKAQDQFNSKLPSYDPRNGAKDNIHLGDEKTDYRTKDKVFTNENMRNTQKGKWKN